MGNGTKTTVVTRSHFSHPNTKEKLAIWLHKTNIVHIATDYSY